MKLLLRSIRIFFGLANLVLLQVNAQCYYPNGDLSTQGDAPCSDEPGSACCPLNWECLSNGLCFLDNEHYFGRYTCTDQTWQSPNCPSICTYSGTASGNEAILECSDGSYCCDTNRPDVGCCDTGAKQFPLSLASVISSIGSLPTGSFGGGGGGGGGSRSSSQSSAVPSSTSAAATSSSTAASTSSPSASPTTDTSSATISSAGPSLITVISIITSAAESGSGEATSTRIITSSASETASPQTSSNSHSNKASIIAPAVAVPVVVISLAILAFLFYRSRRNKSRSPTIATTPPVPYEDKYDPNNRSSAFSGSEATYPYNPDGFAHKPDGGYRGVPATGAVAEQQQPTPPHWRASELDGTAPLSPSRSELAGSSPRTPTTGFGDGNAAGIGNGVETDAEGYRPYRPRPVSELPSEGSGR